MNDKIYNKKIKFVITFILMFIIVALFNNALNWSEYSKVANKVIVTIINLTLMILIPISVTFFKPVAGYIDSCIFKVGKQIKNICSNRKVIIKYVILFGIFVFVACAVECGIVLLTNSQFSMHRFFFEVASATLIFIFVVCHKIAYERTEVLFAVIALIMGITFIVVSPRHLLVSWDDETHFIRSVSLADAVDNTKYTAEKAFYDSLPATYLNSIGELSDQELSDILNNVEKYYSEKDISVRFDSDIGVSSIAYVPAALGIWAGRFLHMNFFHIIMMSKLFNLITYVWIMFYAIKVLKNGKIMLAVIGLTSTTLFMASSLSYDFWVISLCYLGFSLFISEIQNKNEAISYKRIMAILICFFLAFLPKAIYFVILGTLIFLPKTKFVDKTQRRRYIVLIGIVALVLLLTFLIPMLVSTTEIGDSRGGSDVNASQQIMYILANPIEYTRTLLSFLKDYLGLDNSSGYISLMAYLGEGKENTLAIILIGILCFLDRDKEENKYLSLRIFYFINAFICVVLVATALYVSFTAVGANTIAGCQSRYILPLLYPSLYFIGVDGIEVKFSKNAMANISIAIISIIFMNNVWITCIH